MTAIIISIAASIISGMVLFFLQRYFRINEEKANERNKAREKENILILKSIDAIGKLTYADAIAIRDGKTNGEMKAAIEDYNEARVDTYNYLLEQNANKYNQTFALITKMC